VQFVQLTFAINQREADFNLASSDVKGVFAASWESVSMPREKRARIAGYVEFIAAAARKNFFCRGFVAAWKNCSSICVPKHGHISKL
jgi:hypothetical protein